MIIAAWIILIFTALQLWVVLINTFFSQPLRAQSEQNYPLVSILIPARNEEENIGLLLNDILQQNYQNFEILVFNDQSVDRTAEQVKNAAQNDKRIHLVNSSGLPDGWLGKNYGCYSLAQKAKGDYLLFLDADVRIAGNILTSTLQKMQRYKLGLLSIFPKQKMRTWGEYITVPNMTFILLSLLPLIFVRVLPFVSMAAANGQFMLFNAQTYRKHQPHATFCNNKVEDIAIAQYLKQNKIKIACLQGNNNIACHMYGSFSEAVNGFSKNVIMFFGNSAVLAVLFWLITTFGFIPVVLAMPKSLMLTYFIIFLSIRILVSLTSRQNAAKNVLLIIPQQISLGIFIATAFRNKTNKSFTWKGRNIS
ncbi:glycosyltransferase family 2 protein [uncultured Draconibacterium sp.]|uniref:glycosyltransferase n=1 Tax=uncultured Draconibacterium sp. TaxID=1573823 RepID=UPI0025EBF78B|nr:glycosyltransferase family 2 protein [uncultured Draconibacterium sp.]